MAKIAIGPEVDMPSWNWVGFNLSRELSKYFTIDIFRSEIPICDAAIVIKKPVRLNGNMPLPKLIYLPIDFYSHAAQIASDGDYLRSCSAIGCHSESLIPYFRQYCGNTFFMDHDGRYTLRTMGAYRRDGFILWVGGMQHLPYLLKWLELHPLRHPLKILTNNSHRGARKACRHLAAELSVSLHYGRGSVNGHCMMEWTEQAQYRLMREAKAAIDIKGGSWSGNFDWKQYMKPPAKAQKFVSSGIPFAVNQDCYTFDYFKRREFELASPEQHERWLSYDYWRQTVSFSVGLRERILLATIGTQMKEICDHLLCAKGGVDTSS